jgi:hypothetical protein
MKRRQFISLLGGAAAAAWPVAARAQQGERIRRVGVLIGLSADDPQVRLRMDAFLQTLRQLGWIEGRNIQVDFRFGDGDNDKIRKYAEELVVLAPDVIMTPSSATMGALLHVPKLYQSCLRLFLIQSVQVSSRAWRALGAMQPALLFSSTALLGSCWSCSTRSRRV